MKEGEGISQRTDTRNPQTETMVWGWPERRGQAGWRRTKREENDDIYNNVDNKSKVKKENNHCQMTQTLHRHFGAQGATQLWRAVRAVLVATLPLSHRQVPHPGDRRAGRVL